MVDNRLGFFDDEPHLFPNLDLMWDAPAAITNAIIDIDNENYHYQYHKNVLIELSSFNCYCIEFRSYSLIDIDILRHLLSVTQDSRIKEIRFVLVYDKKLDALFRDELIYQHKRIESITFHQSVKNDTQLLKDVHINYVTDAFDIKSCGEVCPGSFSINIEHFSEAVHFNSCLNRKISVDAMGYIKNCPSQEENFGHISKNTLQEALNNNRFQDLWKVKKDDIKICKDCEYRYICTDCRIFKQTENDNYAKPLKCSYDPYTTTWN